MEGKSIHHYRILEELGRGGMGVVYKAEDTKLKRTVALKFLPPNLLTTDEEKARFTHEAQAAASLNHPNICTVYEINEADGQTFISMAFLEGQALNERSSQGPMEPKDVTKIALQVGRGLQAAHDKGIIHRDIKSSNIMVEPGGRATIMDFGLAKSTHQTYKTQMDTKMGTISYMSPEQTRGDQVDHRTDIWSLGVLMYELATGRRPFRGDYDEAVIYSILNEEPAPIADQGVDVPPELEAIIVKAMAKKPADRYQTTAELVDDLKLLHEEMSFESSSSRRTSRLSTIRRDEPASAGALFSPRVLLMLVGYLVAAGIVFVLTGVAADRLDLYPNLARIVMIALYSLVPAMWILAVMVTSRQPIWSRVSRVGVPVNLVITAILLFALFYGRNTGAATETITLQDETGQTIERTVPKKEFRKSLALYFLDNKTGDEANDWLTGGLAFMLEVDLYQDTFIHLRSCVDESARQRLEETGFANWAQAPWNLKRKIADEAHFQYLLTGSFDKEEQDWLVTLQLHDAKSARLVTTLDYRGQDLFTMIDQASAELRGALGVPAEQIENNPDLPVSEMITASMPAMEAFCVGLYEALNQNWHRGLDHLRRAVVVDSTFAYGYFVLAQMYRATGQNELSEQAGDQAMQHLYKLPERIRFIVKANYYANRGETDKFLAVGQMMVDLNPDDIDARQIVATVYSQRNESALAIEQYERILEIDPSRSEFLQTIAGHYQNLGDYDKASEYYQRYLEIHPDDIDAYHAYGRFFENQGEYERSRELYEKALIIDPNRVSVLVDLGDVDGKLGQDESALEKYRKALSMAKTSQDKIRIYESFRSFYVNRGRMSEAIEHIRMLWAVQEESMAPINAKINKIMELEYFVRGGKGEEAFDILQNHIESGLNPPLSELAHLGYLHIYVEIEDAFNAAAALDNLNKAIGAYQWERLRDDAWILEGRIEAIKGNHTAAINAYQEALTLNPNKTQAHRLMGQSYRQLGQADQAITAFEQMLKIFPNDPISHHELALIYHRKGDRKRAEEHLDKALDWWKNADPEFKPAQRARDTQAQWQSPAG